MSATFSSIPASFNTNISDFCRAAGDGLAFDATTLYIQFNTIVGYAATTIDVGGCGTCTITLEDNIFLGYSNPGYNAGLLPGFVYTSGATVTFSPRSNNVIQNMRNTGCPTTGFTGEVCSDPAFVSEPAFVNEASLDNFNFSLAATSPARGKGIMIPGLTADFMGAPRATPPTIGAIEGGASVSTPPTAPQPPPTVSIKVQ
jgi:hypothetical protein